MLAGRDKGTLPEERGPSQTQGAHRRWLALCQGEVCEGDGVTADRCCKYYIITRGTGECAEDLPKAHAETFPVSSFTLCCHPKT